MCICVWVKTTDNYEHHPRGVSSGVRMLFVLSVLVKHGAQCSISYARQGQTRLPVTVHYGFTVDHCNAKNGSCSDNNIT